MIRRTSSRTETHPKQFYDDLVEGKEQRTLLGLDKRFNPSLVVEKLAVKKYFVDAISPFIYSSDSVLDFGCGPGSFLTLISPLCKEVVGFDISQRFVEECTNNIRDFQLENAQAIYSSSLESVFESETFDVIVMVDVVHHLEDPNRTLNQLAKILKRTGRLIIFEPNKLNPLIHAMHYLDRNERGLLKFGTPAAYKRLLESYFRVENLSFNGLVIGPQAKAFDYLTTILNHRLLFKYAGWLNPKIFILANKSL